MELYLEEQEERERQKEKVKWAGRSLNSLLECKQKVYIRYMYKFVNVPQHSQNFLTYLSPILTVELLKGACKHIL